MPFDISRLRQLLPFVVPVIVLAAGWSLLIRPAATERSTIARSLRDAQQRAAAIRRSIDEPIPPPAAGNPENAFNRRLATGDGTAAVLEQLARLASTAQAAELTIETGARVAVDANTNGPRPAAPAVDPRLALFNTPLAYSPITMSFETGYQQVGQFLWELRDLATIVEIRKVEITPQPERAQPTLHVAVAMNAYARPTPARTVGAMP